LLDERRQELTNLEAHGLAHPEDWDTEAAKGMSAATRAKANLAAHAAEAEEQERTKTLAP
jgi:hypothetical protein